MTRDITLAEYVSLAEQVTGIDATVVVKASRIDLADSPLLSAGFGDDDFYPTCSTRRRSSCVAFREPSASR